MNSGPQTRGDPTGPESGAGKRRGGWKRWLVGALVLLLIVFVAQNSQSVEVDFIFARTDTPLVFALLIAGALGAAIGWLAPRLRSRRDD